MSEVEQMHHSVARDIDPVFVTETCNKHRDVSPEEALMPVFQELLEEFGYINESACYQVAHELGLTPMQIYSSLTFYSIYKFRKPGTHKIFLCEGSGCYTVGTTKLRRIISERLGIGAGETTYDKQITFQPFSTCMGACEWSPLVEIDGESYGHVTPEKLNQLLDDLNTRTYAQNQTGGDAIPANSVGGPDDGHTHVGEGGR